jgi:hypothetical protein
LPDLFLKLIAMLQTRIASEVQESRQGRCIADEVAVSEDCERLRIASCRRKPWTTSVTVSYGGELYELIAEDQGVSPRPFVYRLKKNLSLRAIHGIHAYHPEETLRRSWWRAT